MGKIDAWKSRTRQLKGSVYALYYAYRDPRTPWYVRILAACVVGYAFSPIDLIPDPIPILGYLDDIVLIPLGVALVVKLLPSAVWADAQEQASATMRDGNPANWIAAGLIVALWIGVAVLGTWLVWRWTTG
jgi:uncharacterized membrane protein YkvA (DUF1232 family)